MMNEKRCVLYEKICIYTEIGCMLFSCVSVAFGSGLIIYLVLGGSML